MNLSRRHLLSGGFAGLGVLGVSALTGCSTSTEPKSDTGAGDAKKLVLWMWPEGFDKQTLATVAKAQPSYNVRQDIIGGDFKQKLTTTFTAGSGLPDLTGVKGEDIAFFRDHAGYFVDLNTLGAKDIESDYLAGSGPRRPPLTASSWASPPTSVPQPCSTGLTSSSRPNFPAILTRLPPR
ncbi:sugar-binding protein [Cutibacterium acnes JCM 18916]|nr:sugar-binding protein [Cutibacterium acnes JCM 18916]